MTFVRIVLAAAVNDSIDPMVQLRRENGQLKARIEELERERDEVCVFVIARLHVLCYCSDCRTLTAFGVSSSCFKL